MKVLISTSSFGKFTDDSLEKLKKTGLDVTLNPYKRQLRPQESIDLLKGVTGLIAGTEPLTMEVLEKANKLKVISRCGAGLDNVDLEAAKKMGIKVFSTPDVPIESVAELTLGLILSLCRRITESNRNIKNGKWAKLMGELLYNKTLGVIGLGKIGKRLVELIQPFNVDLIACELNPDISFTNKFKIKIVSLNQLLSQADIISIHIPFSPKVQNLIGIKQFNLMKKNALLINTARGGIVDEGALKGVLENKRIKGAALDVFEEEPYNGPLKDMENIILTAHMGTYAKETRIQMESESVDNLLKGLEKN
ncbi:phosphoglycerate dehydrogenase [bacterium]|nr:phosphoglycerate dehydrogenase [bacterium]